MDAQTVDIPLFTVFTATYNRGDLLHRVYEALLVQTNQNFEWLIIDDGSTDSTANSIDAMKRDGRLQIRYFYKENGGVHTAHNMAIRLARGRFFLRLDSDDACSPDAIETLLKAWSTIGEEER